MTTFPLGRAIHRLGIVNPAGWVIDHKIRELGIIPKQLKEELGCEANSISMLRSKTGKPPSFHTSLGRTLVTEIWKAEGQRPELLTETERKNPRRRYAALLDGLTLLSVFKPPRKGEAEPHAFFTRMAEMAGHHAHAQALTLLGEAIYGRLDERPHLKARRPRRITGRRARPSATRPWGAAPSRKAWPRSTPTAAPRTFLPTAPSPSLTRVSGRRRSTVPPWPSTASGRPRRTGCAS